jgi:hypothetical protein
VNHDSQSWPGQIVPDWCNPGLFDRLSTNDRSPLPDCQRQESLTAASSLLVAHQLEFVLFLTID